MAINRMIYIDNNIVKTAKSENYLGNAGLSITVLGVVKLRPDLTANPDTTKKMVHRSGVRNYKLCSCVRFS
jgi:hypothetical protein